MLLRTMLKLATAVALVGATATAIAWAKPAGERPNRTVKLSSLNCEQGETRVTARFTANVRGKLRIDVARRRGKIIARARVKIAKRRTKRVIAHRFGRAASRRILSYAHATRDCRASSIDRTMAVRLRLGSSMKSRRLRLRVRGRCERSTCQPDTAPAPAAPPQAAPAQAAPGGEPGPNGSQPEHCTSLVGRPAPNVGAADLDEASGLVFSRKHEDVLWTHNDSGGDPQLFAIDTDGSLLGRFAVAGAANHDWEDIATGPGPEPGKSYLYIGDIGDNSAVRASISVYRVAEPEQRPDGDAGLPQVERQVLTYPDGARDAETLIVDPESGDLYVVTKREAKSRVYRFDGPWDGTPSQLEYLGALGWSGAVAGDTSPSGNLVALKSYLFVRIYDRVAGESIWQTLSKGGEIAPYIPEPQGEAIALCGNEGVYLTLSEGAGSPLYSYRR